MTVDIASLLLEAALPGMQPVVGAQQALAAQEGDQIASEFEGMVLKLLGRSPPETEVTGEMRAGQQASVEEASDEEAGEESGKPSLDSERLLGSAGMPQGLLCAASAPVCAADSPQMAANPVPREVAKAEPADEIRPVGEPAAAGIDVAPAEILVSPQPVMPASEEVPESAGEARAVRPGWQPQGVHGAARPDKAAQVDEAQQTDPFVRQTGVDSGVAPAAEPQRASSPLGLETEKVAGNAAPPVAETPRGLEIKQETGSAAPPVAEMPRSLEVTTPGTNRIVAHEGIQPGESRKFAGVDVPGWLLDRGVLVTPASPDQVIADDVVAPNAPAVPASDMASSGAQTAAMASAEAPPVVLPEGKPVVRDAPAVLAEVPESAEVLADIAPVERTESNRRDAVESRPHNDSAWMPLSDTRLPGIEAMRAVEQRPAFAAAGPPEEVIGSKLIHQIVRGAKVHLFEGGADMTLRLEPPHLGVLHMSVSAQEGTVTASLQTSTETARRVLEANLFSLKQSLAEAGINVDSINVSVGGSPDQGWMLDSGAHGGRSHAGTHGNPHFSRGLAYREVAYVPSDAYRQVFGGRIDYLA